METLNSIFFYHLEKAIKSYRQYAQGQLKKNGFTITIDQWLILKALHDHPDINQKELAEMVFKDKASITRMLDILIASKYLKKETDENNKRQYKLIITAKGHQVLQDIMPTVFKNRKKALNHLSEKEIASSEKVLKTIIKNCSISDE